MVDLGGRTGFSILVALSSPLPRSPQQDCMKGQTSPKLTPRGHWAPERQVGAMTPSSGVSQISLWSPLQSFMVVDSNGGQWPRHPLSGRWLLMGTTLRLPGGGSIQRQRGTLLGYCILLFLPLQQFLGHSSEELCDLVPQQC